MEENHESKHGMHRQSSSIWMGLIFIFGGAAVLLNQLDILPFELNWWALFILMPAAGFLNSAYRRYQSNDNRLSQDVFFPGFMGLFMVFLSVSLLIGSTWNINWGMLWPIILIVIGAGMLFSREQKENQDHDNN